MFSQHSIPYWPYFCLILFGEDVSPAAPTELDEVPDAQIYVLTPPQFYEGELDKMDEMDESHSGIPSHVEPPCDADMETTPDMEPSGDAMAETAVGTSPHVKTTDAGMAEADVGTPLHVETVDAGSAAHPAESASAPQPQSPDVATPKSLKKKNSQSVFPKKHVLLCPSPRLRARVNQRAPSTARAPMRMGAMVVRAAKSTSAQKRMRLKGSYTQFLVCKFCNLQLDQNQWLMSTNHLDTGTQFASLRYIPLPGLLPRH